MISVQGGKGHSGPARRRTEGEQSGWLDTVKLDAVAAARRDQVYRCSSLTPLPDASRRSATRELAPPLYSGAPQSAPPPAQCAPRSRAAPTPPGAPSSHDPCAGRTVAEPAPTPASAERRPRRD